MKRIDVSFDSSSRVGVHRPEEEIGIKGVISCGVVRPDLEISRAWVTTEVGYFARFDNPVNLSESISTEEGGLKLKIYQTDILPRGLEVAVQASIIKSEDAGNRGAVPVGMVDFIARR